MAKRSNQVHFDPSLATSTNTSANEQTRQSADKKRVSPDEQTNIANRANQSKIQLNPTDLSHISYSLGSANADHSTPFESGALHGALNGGRSEKTSNRPHADNWPSNIDFRSLLSGAELRNLDLLQLLNDPSVRDWLTETIYPDHVGYGATAGIQSSNQKLEMLLISFSPSLSQVHFGLLSVIKHYWKVLFSVDLPRTSAHYHPQQVDKYARVFVPLLYLLWLAVYVMLLVRNMDIDNKATLENIFAYKEREKETRRPDS